MKKAYKIAFGAGLVLAGSLSVGSYIARKYIKLAVKRNYKKYSNEKNRNATLANKTPEEIKALVSNHNIKTYEAKKWREEVPAQQLYVTSRDGLELYGELYKNPNSKKYVIIVHGYNCNLEMMYPLGPDFYNMGFNVLFVDLRAHGKSEGDTIGMGWLERLDLINWCNLLIQYDPDCEIVLYGQSMGAAAVMMASGEDSLPENVKVIIEDSGYTSIHDIFDKIVRAKVHIPAAPLIALSSYRFKKMTKYNIKDGDAIKQLKKNTRPTLFIHCSDDSYIPFPMVYKLYSVTGGPKDIYTVTGGEHVMAYYVDPVKYMEHVKAFLDKYLD